VLRQVEPRRRREERAGGVEPVACEAERLPCPGTTDAERGVLTRRVELLAEREPEPSPGQQHAYRGRVEPPAARVAEARAEHLGTTAESLPGGSLHHVPYGGHASRPLLPVASTRHHAVGGLCGEYLPPYPPARHGGRDDDEEEERVGRYPWDAGERRHPGHNGQDADGVGGPPRVDGESAGRIVGECSRLHAALHVSWMLCRRPVSSGRRRFRI
jgi:hypothetical protein